MGFFDSILGQNTQDITPTAQWGGIGAGTMATQHTPGEAQWQIDAEQKAPGFGDAYAQGQTAQGQNAGQQQQALGLMRGAAMGNAPSAAELQMQGGTEDAIKAQMSMANSARGGGLMQAMAQREAANRGVEMQQAGNFQAAQLRAQEMAQARGQYGQATDQARGQDIQNSLGAGGLSNQAASAQQQAQMQTQSLQYQKDHSNAAAMQAGVSGLVGAASSGAAAFGTGGASLAVPGGVPSDARNKARIEPLSQDHFFVDGWVQGRGDAKSDVHSKTRIEDLSRENAALTSALADRSAPNGHETAAGYARVGGDLVREGGLSDVDTPFGFIADRKAPIPFAGDGSTWDRGRTPVPRIEDNIGNAIEQAGGAQDTYVERPKYQPEASGIAHGAMGGFTRSDKRAKTEVDDFLDPLNGYAFDYKNPQRDGEGRHYGVMAQDLERSPMGASLVRDTPDGKVVDTRKGTMAAMAALSDHQKRLNAIERSSLGPRGR